MRAAPAFELHVVPSRTERVALALLGGLSAAATASWLWSHVDAAAGLAGHGASVRLGVAFGAALLGGWLGWAAAPRSSTTLCWRQGCWALRRADAEFAEGQLQARLDLGGWLLLRFQSAGDGRPSWFGVSRRQAGPAWHPLRATLFAPGAAGGQRGHDDGVQA